MNPTRGILFVFLFITSSLAQIQLQCVVKGSSRDVATAQLTIDGTNCGNGDCSLVKDKEFRYTLEFTPGIPNMRNVELSGTIFGLILHNNGHYGLKIISDNRKCTDFEKNKTDSNCSLEAKKAYKLSSQFKLDKEVQETGKIVWVLTLVKNTAQTNSLSVEEHSIKDHHNWTKTVNESLLPNRDRREAPPEFTIIKHKSRPSKRHPGYRSRRRPKPKPKPVYGPPNFSYGSPISDYTLGYSSKGQKTKTGDTSSYSSLEATYESDFSPPLKTNLYSGHSSYEATFKNGNKYISAPQIPAENYGFSYTPPPSDLYSNQGTKNFAEPPRLSENNDLAGAGTHSIKSIPPSTNYGVPVAPIHHQSQSQNTQLTNNQQHEYISNLYNSFSAPTTSQSQPFYNSPNIQTIYTNPSILTSAEINTIGANAIAGITGNRVNVPAGVSATNFNQDALNSLTFKSYATSQPPQVKYVPASVTISSSKEIILNRKPLPGKFAEPPQNIVNSYQTPLTPYDVPIQFDSSKVTYNIDAPDNQFNPNIYNSPPNSPQNSWQKSPTATTTTTTERHKYLPPTLPTSYDQSQFNGFSEENDYSGNYNKQQSDFLDVEGDYDSLFDVPHESKKVHKTKLTKTYAGANLQSEDSPVDSFEIPSDEYVDELIRATTTKRPRIRSRRTKPTVASTTHHILDTEDLRDAFSSGSVQYSLSVNPREKIGDRSQSKVAKDKNFVLLASANKNRTWSRPFPKRQQSSFDPITDVKAFLGNDSAGKTNSSNKGIEILSIQKSKSHSYYAGTVAPSAAFKRNDVSRYDQPKYDDSMFNVVSTNVRMANNASNNVHSKLPTGAVRSRRTKKQNFEDSKEIGDNDAKEIDPIFWNGQKLPDNHKLSKRIA